MQFHVHDRRWNSYRKLNYQRAGQVFQAIKAFREERVTASWETTKVSLILQRVDNINESLRSLPDDVRDRCFAKGHGLVQTLGTTAAM